MEMYLKRIPRLETNVSGSCGRNVLQALHAKTRVALIDYNLYASAELACVFFDGRRRSAGSFYYRRWKETREKGRKRERERERERRRKRGEKK